MEPDAWGFDIGSPVILLGLEDAGEATADAVRAAHARAVSAVGPALLPVRPARRPIAESPPVPIEPQEGVAELSGEQRAACAVVLCRHIDLAARLLREPAVRRKLAGRPRGSRLVAGLAALALAVPGAPCPACGGDGGDGAPAHVFDEAAPAQRCPRTGRLVRTAEPIEPAAVRRLFGPPDAPASPPPRSPDGAAAGTPAPRPVRRDAFRDRGRLLKLLASLGAGEQAAELRDLLPLRALAARLCAERGLDVSHCDPLPERFLAAAEAARRIEAGGVVDPEHAAQTYSSRSFFRRGTEDIRQFALRHLPAEAPADEVLEMDRDAVVALVVLVARRLGWPAPDPGRQPGAQRWLEMSDAQLVALRSGDELAAARAPRDATTGGGGGDGGGAWRSKRRRRGEPGVSHASAIEDEEAD
eukprot:tig00020509_g9744.t1